MQFLNYFLERAFEIGFLLMAFGIAVGIATCSIRQEIKCPQRPDEKALMIGIQKVIDKEFSK